MANFKHMTIAGKQVAVNVDQIVYAEIDGEVIHLVSPAGNVTNINGDGASIDEVWNFLFPKRGDAEGSSPSLAASGKTRIVIDPTRKIGINRTSVEDRQWRVTLADEWVGILVEESHGGYTAKSTDPGAAEHHGSDWRELAVKIAY